MSNFPEKLRQVMHEKRCKSADVAKATGINPSVLSRYLSGRNKPSSDNILAISHYLNVSPEWLLSSSDASESTKKSQVISSATEPLLKTIEVQDKLIKNLEKQITAQSHYIHALFKNLEEAKAKSKERHTKGKAKQTDTKRLIELLKKKGITVTPEMTNTPTGSSYRDRAIVKAKRELVEKDKVSQKTIEELREIINRRKRKK